MFAFVSLRNTIKLSMPKIYTKIVFSSNLHLYKLYLNTPLEGHLKATVFLDIDKKE